MKKIMKRIGIGIILCIICFCAYGWFREINPIVMKAHADLDVPENLEDLEGKTDLIVTVKITKEKKEYVNLDTDGIPLHGHTLTKVEVVNIVDGVIEGETTVLTICEPYYHYKVFGVQNYLMTVENYKPLLEGEEYLLFLKKASGFDEMIYHIVGSQYGKFVTNILSGEDRTAETLSLYEMDEHYEKLYGDVCEQYLSN